jgi:hypothetical protein
MVVSAEQSLRLSSTGNVLLCVACDLVLELVGLIGGKCAFRSWSASFTCMADVFVVPYGILAETLEYTVFPRPKAVDPGVHVLHHFSLHLGRIVMEIGVESMTARIQFGIE